MSTIYKIAERAGVSPSTVARALSGTGYCSAEKREKILKIAQEMNYNPSYAARALKNKRTEKILFCIPDIYNPFYFKMIKGVSDVLDDYNYLPVLCYTKGRLENELKMIQNLQEGYGDGMIMVSFDFNEKNIAAISASNAPVVLTNYYAAKPRDDIFDCVYIDTQKGIHLAVEYLLKKGYRKIAYIGGDSAVQTGRERLKGFLSAMDENHEAALPQYIKEGDFSKESGKKAMDEILTAAHRPEAVVVANDLMAIGAMAACKEKNVKIPEEMAVIGMDNSELAEVLALSSIQMKEEEIGRQAARLLMERIEKGKRKQKILRLEPDLFIRESSEGK